MHRIPQRICFKQKEQTYNIPNKKKVFYTPPLKGVVLTIF